jgi:hypothetical protein
MRWQVFFRHLGLKVSSNDPISLTRLTDTTLLNSGIEVI